MKRHLDMFMRGTLRLGRIAGIDIGVHPSWLVIFAMIAWSATVLAKTLDPKLGKIGYAELGIAFALALFAGVVAHELAHALVARRLGIPTSNITLFLFGGVANIKREPGSPADELMVAAAGPAASVVIGAACYGLALALPDGFLSDLTYLLGISNVALAVFNLLPAFPSDGGRILRAIIWHFRRSQARATSAASMVSLAVAGLLVASGVYIAFAPQSDLTAGTTIGRGWWWVLIGLFLGQAALASMRGARASLILEQMPVNECMARTLIPVPTTTTIAGFVAEMAESGRVAGYPVVNDGAFVGLVTLQDTSAVPHALWPQTPVTAVMTPSSRTPFIAGDTPASDALAALDAQHVGELPVSEDGTLTGVVSKETIYTELRAREKARSA